MSRREKLKQNFGDITDNVKGFFIRTDKSTTKLSTPFFNPPHTTTSTSPNQAVNLETIASGALSSAQIHPSLPLGHPSNSSSVGVHSEPLLESTVPATEDHLAMIKSSSNALEVSANAAIPSEQAGSGSQILSDQSAHEPKQKPFEKPSSRKDLMTVARGALGSTAGILKIGPLQDVFHQFGVLGEAFKMKETAEKEYEILQDMVQALLNRLSEEFGEESPSTPHGIERLRKSIEKELETIKKKQGRSQSRRMLEAHKDADEIQGCYRRISGYWGQLTLDTNHEIRKMTEEKSKIDLNRLPSSPSAQYNSSAGAELKRRECTLGTRVNVLANVLGWANNSNVGGVYWLNGMAGTGKTTIAYSICKELAATGNLAASFFCSRVREECRNVNVIIPSIAYQLACLSLPFRSALLVVLEKDPEIHTKRLSIQFQALIQDPLLVAQPLPTEGLVVVIDALDECDNKDSTRDILDLLLTRAAALPIKFIVSSRPEPQIRSEMTDDRAKSRMILHELGKGEVQEDIEKYLREELAPMSPSEEQIAALVGRAGILFIYAATAVRYIGYDKFRSDPEDRLRDVLDGPHSSEEGGRDEIDELYMTVLEAALGNQKLRKAQRELIQQVLYTVLCAREPLTVTSLSKLLMINNMERVRTALGPLWSVLHVMEESELVTTLHASFPDFMFDLSRSKSYFCNSHAHHRKLAEDCFDYIARTQPQFNICGLESSYISDEDVPDIQRRVAKSISSELLYACRYWADHVKAAQCASDVLGQMRDFLSIRLLLWMEVLNLTNYMKTGIECAKRIVEWYRASEEEKEVFGLAQDAKRFVEAFVSNPASRSTPHIYISMLAFWPRSAPITKYYAKYTRGPMEVEGTALARRQLAHLSTWVFEMFIEAVAVSPDGLHIGLTIYKDLLVVDSSSGKIVLGPLRGHPNEVGSIVFSPDGLRILAASFEANDNFATIVGWDTQTGNTVLGPLHLHGHADRIICLSFSPDCSRIATGSDDKTVCLWDAEAGKMLYQLEAQRPVCAVVFSSDGNQVAAGAGNTLRRWNSRTGQSTHIPLTYIDSVLTVAFSPDQSCIIACGWNIHTIYVWNAHSGDMIRSIEGHIGSIRSVGYSPDGRFIVSGSRDRTVRVWDAETGDLVLGPLEGHTNRITSVSFSPDGSRIVSACADGLVCTWDARQRNLTTNTPSNSISCVKFISDETHVVSGPEEGTISTWDSHTGEMVLGPVKVHTSRIIAVDIKNNHVVSGSRDGKICVCDARSGEVVLGPIEVSSTAVQAISYSPSGELIATGSSAGVDVWNAEDGSRKLNLLTDLAADISSVQFSPDGARIVAGSNAISSNLALWDLSDGRNVFGTLDGHIHAVRSVSYSPNGALIASGSYDLTIILWDAYTGKKAIGPLTSIRHNSLVLSISFSPDSTRLASGSEDRTIRIWNVQTGEMMFELLHGHEDGIASVEYSPDGTRILSRSNDMSARIHDARSPEERERSRSESEVGDWKMRKDGWVVDDQSRLLVRVPADLWKSLMWPRTYLVIGRQGYVRLKFNKSRLGESWAEGYASNI